MVALIRLGQDDDVPASPVISGTVAQYSNPGTEALVWLGLALAAIAFVAWKK